MHLANYAKMSRDLVEVRGICSRTRESGDALARESRLAFVTDDYASLLARDDIDVVDICVPPALHHDFAIRAAADRGFQGFDPRTSRRRKPLGFKLGVFEGLEINRGRG